MTSVNNANVAFNSPVFADLLSIVATFEKIGLLQINGAPGYSNTEIQNYIKVLTASAANGGIRPNPWNGNTVMVNIANAFYQAAALV